MSPTPDYLRHAAEQMADALWRAMQQAVSEGTAPAIMSQPTTAPMPSTISARDLLRFAGMRVDRDILTRFQKRLKRFRDRNFGCCFELPSNEGGTTSYIYLSHAVERVAQEFVADFRRKENGSIDR
jgi:uncharacterized protein (DUF4415 family)